MAVVIRPIEPTDTDGYVAAFAAVAAEGRWIGAEAPLRDTTLEALRRATDPPDGVMTLVAVDDSRDAEVVGWIFTRLDPSGRTSLGMGLVAGSRGQGLGRQLLDRAIAWSREVGAHKVELEVWPSNARAIRLYESAGFVREGYLRRHWRRDNGELWDVVHMGLVLDDVAPPEPPDV